MIGLSVEKEFNRDGERYLVVAHFRSSDHLHLKDRWDFDVKLWNGTGFSYYALRQYDFKKNPAENGHLNIVEKWKYISPEELHEMHLELWEKMKPKLQVAPE